MEEKFEELKRTLDKFKENVEKIESNIEGRIYCERRLAGYEDLEKPRGLQDSDPSVD